MTHRPSTSSLLLNSSSPRSVLDAALDLALRRLQMAEDRNLQAANGTEALGEESPNVPDRSSWRLPVRIN